MQYHKIQTIFKRDPETNYKTLLEGKFSEPHFEYLKDNLWTFTEKVDGMNIRIMLNEGRVYFGGRTDNAQIPAPLVNRLNELFMPLRDKLLSQFGDAPTCLYGEGYGGKIQKAGSTYGKTQDFVLFDVKVDNWWLERSNVNEIAWKFGLGIVPIVGMGTIDQMVGLVKDGLTSRWGDFLAEGIVARPAVELFARSGKQIITKLKTKDFQ